MTDGSNERPHLYPNKGGNWIPMIRVIVVKSWFMNGPSNDIRNSLDTRKESFPYFLLFSCFFNPL